MDNSDFNLKSDSRILVRLLISHLSWACSDFSCKKTTLGNLTSKFQLACAFWILKSEISDLVRFSSFATLEFWSLKFDSDSRKNTLCVLKIEMCSWKWLPLDSERRFEAWNLKCALGSDRGRYIPEIQTRSFTPDYVNGYLSRTRNFEIWNLKSRIVYWNLGEQKQSEIWNLKSEICLFKYRGSTPRTGFARCVHIVCDQLPTYPLFDLYNLSADSNRWPV